MADAAHDDAGARAQLRGKRVALVFVIVLAVVFIGASALQIVPAVFGAGTTRMPPAPPGSPSRICADGVRALAAALDRAGARALAAPPGTASNSDEVLAGFRAGLAPEWNDEGRIEPACARSREGEDAWAALMRLRFAQEQLVRRGNVVLGPLRGDLAAHLPD
jgi:hypothetical protein